MELSVFFVSQSKYIPVTSTSCTAVTSNQAELLWVCLFRDIYSCVCGSLCQNSENKSETPTNQMLKYISAAAHHADLENIVLLLHFGFIFAPFFFNALPLFATKQPQITSFTRSVLDCCVLILQTDLEFELSSSVGEN